MRGLGLALPYAMRSILRSKRRSLLSMATVAFAVCVVLVADRYIEGMLELWSESSADHGTGHLQIHASGYSATSEGLQRERLLQDEGKLRALLGEDSVEAVSRRIRFEGIISAVDKTIYFLGIAVDPDAERAVAPKIFSDDADQGQFLSTDNPRGIVIGRGMADTLDLDIGDEASLTVQTIKEGTNVIDVVVIGIVELPVPALSKRLVLMNLGVAQKGLRLEDEAMELAVRLKNIDLARPFVTRHAERIKAYGAHVQGWWEIDPYIVKAESVADAIIGVTAFLLFLCAGISILNIIFMVVAERTVEIGTLMALGASPSFIRLVFGLEAMLMGAAGAIVGVTAGIIIVFLLGTYGVEFRSPFGSGYVVIHPANDLSASLSIASIALCFCVLASIPPAAKAARVEPVRAFRGQIA